MSKLVCDPVISSTMACDSGALCVGAWAVFIGEGETRNPDAFVWPNTNIKCWPRVTYTHLIWPLRVTISALLNGLIKSLDSSMSSMTSI